jgi:hypothetical protein
MKDLTHTPMESLFPRTSHQDTNQHQTLGFRTDRDVQTADISIPRLWNAGDSTTQWFAATIGVLNGNLFQTKDKKI